MENKSNTLIPQKLHFINQLLDETTIRIELILWGEQRLQITTDLFNAINYLEQYYNNHKQHIEKAQNEGGFELIIERVPVNLKSSDQ